MPTENHASSLPSMMKLYKVVEAIDDDILWEVSDIIHGFVEIED